MLDAGNTKITKVSLRLPPKSLVRRDRHVINATVGLAAMTDVCLGSRGDTEEEVLPGRGNCGNKAVMVKEPV